MTLDTSSVEKETRLETLFSMTAFAFDLRRVLIIPKDGRLLDSVAALGAVVASSSPPYAEFFRNIEGGGLGPVSIFVLNLIFMRI